MSSNQNPLLPLARKLIMAGLSGQSHLPPPPPPPVTTLALLCGQVCMSTLTF